MTALVVAIALVVGVVCSEVIARSTRSGAWPARCLATILQELHLFHEATDDDRRQLHLIRGGWVTLALSLALLTAVSVIAAVFVAPMLVLEWDRADSTVYLAVSGVSAIAWWILRRAQPVS